MRKLDKTETLVTIDDMIREVTETDFYNCMCLCFQISSICSCFELVSLISKHFNAFKAATYIFLNSYFRGWGLHILPTLLCSSRQTTCL